MEHISQVITFHYLMYPSQFFPHNPKTWSVAPGPWIGWSVYKINTHMAHVRTSFWTWLGKIGFIRNFVVRLYLPVPLTSNGSTTYSLPRGSGTQPLHFNKFSSVAEHWAQTYFHYEYEDVSVWLSVTCVCVRIRSWHLQIKCIALTRFMSLTVAIFYS